jgi:D-alanyl-D-alanine carboxypeptidase/D-alanyl-D-alanine-endopeptidase (penicillin-binding protein 4)
MDEGRIAPGSPQRVPDPPRTVAEAFAHLLGKQGVTAHVGARTNAPAGVRRLGAVQSPPISALVEQLLTNSDNDIAEAMARQVAISLKQPPSFDGGAAAVHDTLTRLGVAAGIDTVDGSGLSPRNQITPAALARLLALTASPPPPALRRAKTGTLNGVNTLAGVVYDADGRLLAFAFMANNVQSPVAALGSLDTLAGTLASCGCR